MTLTFPDCNVFLSSYMHYMSISEKKKKNRLNVTYCTQFFLYVVTVHQ